MSWANLSSLALMVGYGSLRPLLVGWVCLVGAFVVLWAIRLCLVQPKARRDQVGWTAQLTALLIAVPLVVLGAVIIYLGVNLPEDL